MYISEHFEERELTVLHGLIEAHPLGTWVTAAAGPLEVNHIPFVLETNRGEFGTLVGHVARANNVWKSASATESVVVFQGPESYITPSWYPTKHEHGKAVPTWNYVVVHAHGVPRVIDEPEWLRQHVAELTHRHEAGREVPWHVSDAPSGYIDALLGGIVGIEIPIARLVGKWKVSQNRALRDQLGVISGLIETRDVKSQQMAQAVRSRQRLEG
jgi:transcriptional regulator